MISRLSGTLLEKQPTQIILSVFGVGYELFIPLSTFSLLPEVGEEISLLTHLHVREDAWCLYGFASADERRLFRLVISISGIGPKAGLTILSGIGVDGFKRAVRDRDLVSLTAISGIGKKTAERIIIELKDKLGIDDSERSDSREGFGDGSSLLSDSRNALMALGYKKEQAETAVKKVMKNRAEETTSVEDIIRLSLQMV
jgi:holliday junction DNA helicase RuvA